MEIFVQNECVVYFAHFRLNVMSSLILPRYFNLVSNSAVKRFHPFRTQHTLLCALLLVHGALLLCYNYVVCLKCMIEPCFLETTKAY